MILSSQNTAKILLGMIFQGSKLLSKSLVPQETFSDEIFDIMSISL